MGTFEEVVRYGRVPESATRARRRKTQSGKRLEEAAMRRHAEYDDLKDLAREKRKHYGVATEAFGLREVSSLMRNP